jgi:hypothetical protein
MRATSPWAVMLMDEILCLRENGPAVALALRGTRDRMLCMHSLCTAYKARQDIS